MIFGNPLNFAVEAFAERGPNFPPSFGGNIHGSMRLLIGGVSVGSIDEPSCVLRNLSEHLTELCAAAPALWHPSLSGRSPEQQFQMLDQALFLGGGDPELERCHETVFLTNVSEAFDPIKGFALSSSFDEILVLLRLENNGPLIHRSIPFADFQSATSAFANWVAEQEGIYLSGAADVHGDPHGQTT